MKLPKMSIRKQCSNCWYSTDDALCKRTGREKECNNCCTNEFVRAFLFLKTKLSKKCDNSPRPSKGLCFAYKPRK